MTFHRAVKRYKRRLILEAIDAEAGNLCRAAERLGVHRNTISRTIAQVGLDSIKIKKILKGAA